MQQNMSSGKITSLLILFMLPILGGNLFQHIYTMVDTFVVGNFVGVGALAAVGATGAINFFILGFVIGLTAGFSVIISQKFGADDYQSMRKAVAMSIICSAVLSSIVTMLAVGFAMPLLKILQTPQDIIGDAYAYLIVLYLGITATVFYNLFASILRALGDSRSPLYFLLIASILNILGDLVAVIQLQMGVMGVALATIISQGISAVLCLMYIRRRYPILKLAKQDWKFDIAMVGRLLRIGLPSALQFSVCAIGVMVVQVVINNMGSNTVAAYSIGTRIEQLITQPLLTLGLAMATFSAQNLGSGQIERIKEGLKSAIWLTVLLSMAATLLVYLFASQFASLFINKNELDVIYETTLYLRIVSLFFIPLGLIFVLRNTSQGLGSGLIGMLSSIQELVFRTIVAFTLPKSLGYIGICLSSPVAWIAAAGLLIVAYRLQIQKLTTMLKQ